MYVRVWGIQMQVTKFFRLYAIGAFEFYIKKYSGSATSTGSRRSQSYNVSSNRFTLSCDLFRCACVWVCVSERHPETKQKLRVWVILCLRVSLHKYVRTHTHANEHTHIHARTYMSARTLSLTWVIFICCATIPILQPTISVSKISKDTMIPAVVVASLLLAIFIVVAPPSLAFVSSV